MSIKFNAVLAALAASAAMLQKLTDNYGSLNSMDSDFKALKSDVDTALALPADPTAGELAPQFTVMSEEQFGVVMDRVSAEFSHRAEVIGAQVADNLEKSDVAVLAALAEVRTDVLQAITPQ